jgi:hypothetical protein
MLPDPPDFIERKIRTKTIFDSRQSWCFYFFQCFPDRLNFSRIHELIDRDFIVHEIEGQVLFYGSAPESTVFTNAVDGVASIEQF